MNKIEELIEKLCPDGVEMIELGEVCDTTTDFTAAGSFASNAKNVKYLEEESFALLVRTTDLKSKFKTTRNTKLVYIDEHAFNYLYRVNLDKESIILPNVGNCGEVYYVTPSDLPFKNNVLGPNAILVRSSIAINKYLYYLFKSDKFQNDLSKIVSPTGQTKFNKTNLRKIKIPIPPLPIQEEIVKILDSIVKLKETLEYEKELRIKQFEYYREKLLNFEGREDVEWKELGEVCDTTTDFTAAGSFASNAKNVKYLDEESFALLVRTTDLKSKFKTTRNTKLVYIDEHAFNYLYRVNLDKESIILPNVGNCGEVYYVTPSDLPFKNNVLGPNAILVRSSIAINKYLYYLFKSDKFQKDLSKIISPTGQTKFNKTNLRKIKIPISQISEQQKIVEILDKFDKLIKLLEREIELRQKQYEYYREKLLNFKIKS